MYATRKRCRAELSTTAVPKEPRPLAFVLGPTRKAVPLVADEESGSDGSRSYRALILLADDRFNRQLEQVKGAGS